MQSIKFKNRGFYGTIAITMILISMFAVSLNIKPTNAGGGDKTSPSVAIHVSEYTEAHWTQTSWTYFSIYEMLEEALMSDGTPFIEISDAQIEVGGLLNSGQPKYPILFSLAAECISNTEASQILAYVDAGGFVYAGSSSWTRNPDGSARADFALSTQMGVKCSVAPPNDWAQVTSITRVTSNRIVDHLPGPGVSINWQIPLTSTTIGYRDSSAHYAWMTQVTTADPTTVLVTTSSYIMLATKAYSNGRFIYHSELAPLAGFSIVGPHGFEYIFFRKAIEWAFEARRLPLARLSAWQYQYNSAFIIRHDMCYGGSDQHSYGYITWIDESVQAENALGVTGEYYIVSGEARDSLAYPGSIPATPANLIANITHADSLGGIIGSHAGGLSSAPWTGITNHQDRHYYHWGPDEGIKNYASNLTYTEASLNISLNDLESWLGVRPENYVSPEFNGAFEKSLEYFDALSIETCDGQYIGPFPHFGLSVGTKNKHFNVLVIPTSENYRSDGAILQSMEHSGHTTATIKATVDLYYGLGALVNIYMHSPSFDTRPNYYITYCLSKPNMWATTSSQIRDWWLIRQPVSISPSYQVLPDNTRNVTITLGGSTSPDIALDLNYPVPKCQIYNVQVKLDGVPTTDFRQTDSGIKVKAGLASKVTITYKELDTESWTQTTQADFETGTQTNLNTTSSPGDVQLASQPANATVLFSDDFSNATWTNSHWTVKYGTWSVTSGVYRLDSSAGGPPAEVTCAGSSSWTDYVVEARARYVSGNFGPCLTGRLNPTTGARYSLWTYPQASYGGPNKAQLLRMNDYMSSGLISLGSATITTDTGWHTLKMEFKGSTIKCYYDNALIISVTDSTFPTGCVACESWASSTVEYDWMTVKELTPTTYAPSGTLVSRAFDTGFTASWLAICWSSSTPAGTSVKLRTRTAATQAGLDSASWSGYYTVTGSVITSPGNRWMQWETTLSTSSNTVTPTLYDVTVHYGQSNTAFYIDPSTTQKTHGDIGTKFKLNVTIADVEDLWGFDFNLTWDDSLITLTHTDFSTTLNDMWGSGNWFLGSNGTGPGFYDLAAVSLSRDFNGTAVLAVLEFRVENPASNSPRQTAIHFETHKLSDSKWTAITHVANDALYTITGQTPTLQLTPPSVTCRKYNEQFQIKINVSDAYNIEDFEFEVHFNTTLLDCTGVTWSAWGNGTPTINEATGVVSGSTSGDHLTGPTTLVTMHFAASYYHIWKDESTITGWKNDLTGAIYIQWANLSYPTAPDLGYVRGGLNQINVSPDVSYKFSPIQGDVNNDGKVDIFDLGTIAHCYDAKPGDPIWPQASPYDLTRPSGSEVIDIFDIVVVGSNFGYTY